MNADVHALAGAYALDALPPEEAAAFGAHLVDCSACQLEVAELQVTAAQLGVAVAEPPPDRIRAAVLRAAQQTRQMPPATRQELDGGGRRQRPRRTWLAAAAAVLVVAAGGAIATGVLDDDPADPGPDPIAAVIEAPDADSAVARLRGGGHLTVVNSARLQQAVVLSEELPPPGAGRVYQLWLVDPDGAARSAEVLLEGPGSADLVRGVRAGDQLAITREPAGGSEQPTTTPLAVTKPL